MAIHIKNSTCSFRHNGGRRQRSPDGIVLVIVMIVATLLLIGLTAALPSVYQEGQREREEELIFRGTQYARAVALFHKQFNRYPVSLKELEQTNGMRFLRKEFRDPMDPKGAWRFIHVSASGVLLDSINQKMPNSSNPAGIGTNNSSSTNSPSGGNSSFGNSSFGSSSFGNSSFGNSNSSGFQGNSNSSGFQLGGIGSGTNPPTGGPDQIGPTSSTFGNQNQIQGAYIAGVAATSKHESIRVWKKYHHYNEWEFIGLDMGVFGIQVGMPTSGATGTGPQGPGVSPGGFGLNTTSPTVGPPQN